MTTAPLRKDAARNWQHIVGVGRRFVDEGTPLRLNEVARAASIGVATVYRHFPTPEALLETLAMPAFERLVTVAERSLAAPDPWTGFTEFLTAGIDAQLEDASVQPVFAASTHALPETTALVNRLKSLSGHLLGRARTAGVVDPGLTEEDVIRLMCGVVFAATVHATPAERPSLTRRYLSVVLTGLKAQAS